MREQIEALIPENIKANLMLKAFGLTKVPLLFATGAKVTSIDDTSCVVRIPFIKIIKNHLGSMYFGALAIGADACIGILAAHKIYHSGENISLVFKSFKADFIKRPIGPTEFVCEEGSAIDELIAETLEKKERCHRIIKAVAKTNNEVVAEFELELSLKAKS